MLTRSAVMAFGFYHLSRMLLVLYKPTPRFAVRGFLSGPRESDVCLAYSLLAELSLTLPQLQVLEHARAICGACWCQPATVPSLITLCHTVFICQSRPRICSQRGRANNTKGGPLMTSPKEQEGVLGMLDKMERDEAWPTAWITKSLKEEWKIA